MGEHGLMSAINAFTRVEGKSGSCIDHLFIKDSKQYLRCLPIILETSITDHFSIITQLIEPERKSTINCANNTKQYLDNEKLISELQKRKLGRGIFV
ncbi:hypothetical protein NQ314_016062 [Rhamnusium bicolor]|uniref:Uncharacterized protein n=1 Tax=Rhamnusium bicolor TaxID=1586634 RepID=A0AAV8WWQ1_9CUCU|nr:hypothetical protein NQ314_016062 [Rhamnusium bicolor]